MTLSGLLIVCNPQQMDVLRCGFDCGDVIAIAELVWGFDRWCFIAGLILVAKGLWVVLCQPQERFVVLLGVLWYCMVLWVVREPQKRAQDLGIKLQQRIRAASALPRVAPPWWELVPLKCLSNILPPASPPVLLEEMLTESKCFSSFPLTLNF